MPQKSRFTIGLSEDLHTWLFDQIGEGKRWWNPSHAVTEAVRLMVRYGFLSLDLRRIWLGTAAGNAAARRCFARAGFREEGIRREEFLGPDGVASDNVMMAVLRKEWSETA